jgi:hypothetical protein
MRGLAFRLRQGSDFRLDSVNLVLPSHEEIIDGHSSPMADARLEFLNASARHYAITAPATAAYLMLQHAQVAEETGLPYRKDHPPDTCRACGTIEIVDETADNSASESEIAKQRLKAPVTLPSAKLMASPSEINIFEIKCAACHRITRKPAARLGAAGRNGPRKQQATTAAPPQSGASTSEDISKKGTRQRPKAKKRGGLQAMVERSRISRDTGLASGLDLMDLMKAG